MSANTAIADIFYEIADLLDMQGVQWKPRAYRNGARALESADDVEQTYRSGGRKALLDIAGIGEALADKIIEYLENGKIREYEKLTAKLPAGVHDMMHIMGVGPKKAWRLYKELSIKSVSELEKAAKAGKLQKLSGFGAKSEQDILRGIETLKKGHQRMPLGKAWTLCNDIVARLRRVPGVQKIEPSGSLRRRQETVGDIDVLVISTKPAAVMDAFATMPNVERILAKGPTKSAVLLREGLTADVRVLEPRSFGAALQYFTGNKEHNVAVRQLAIKKSYKLNEYGLFKGTKYVAGKNEEDVYKKLGLRWIPPELRQNNGEIKAAQAGKLPALIEYGSLKGDLHLHTRWSDGTNTTEEMVRAAIRQGYEYVAITDHSKSEYIAHGMDEKRLAKYVTEISKLKKKYAGDIVVLAGSEVDILADGKLDYATKYLDLLDWVVASVHSRFKQPRDEMTKRILAALSNDHVNALGHPTGRLINEREPYDADMAQVILAAKDNNVALEVNSSPARLDLKDAHIRAAVEAGAKLVISTDAHHENQLSFTTFGIAQARRGWATAQDVLNTLPWKKFEKYMNK
jgi:DNA polymerase (family 10)